MKKITIIMVLLAFLLVPARVYADQIRDASVFEGTVWERMTGWSLDTQRASLQSMCITDKYIVCYHDNKKKGKADTLIILDKDTYEVLREVEDTDYEHGNGMTYNNLTHEVIIAPYTCKDKANSGCLFILDAETFQLKRKVKISNSWDPSAVEYLDNSNQYVVQTNAEGDFTFHLYDSEFNYVDTLFAGNTSLDNRFQDFCVSGDFIISVPYLSNKETGYIQVYSISQRRYLGNYPLYLDGVQGNIEAESIAITDAGRIVLAVIVKDNRSMTLFSTYVPVIYTVTTSVENGEITPTRGDVDMGSDYKVEYSCTEDYELKQLVVDGAEVDYTDHKDNYVFGNILDDHSIFARFTEIPKFDITTAVTNGTIDDSQVIRRDLDVTIHYEPDLHYEMDKLLIDGAEVDATGHESEYTFEFIQGPHSVNVLFKEIPSFMVSTQAYHGTITPDNPKVYRDENYTVEYEPEKDYQLSYMKIDGQWQNKINLTDVEKQYTFENMQKAHDVVVVFQWKYMSLAILAGGFALCIPMAMIYMVVMRIRKKRKKGARP